MRNCFEGSKIHLPTLWLDAVDACMTCLQVWFLASLLSYATQKGKQNAFLLSLMLQMQYTRTRRHEMNCSSKRESGENEQIVNKINAY